MRARTGFTGMPIVFTDGATTCSSRALGGQGAASVQVMVGPIETSTSPFRGEVMLGVPTMHGGMVVGGQRGGQGGRRGDRLRDRRGRRLRCGCRRWGGARRAHGARRAEGARVRRASGTAAAAAWTRWTPATDVGSVTAGSVGTPGSVVGVVSTMPTFEMMVVGGGGRSTLSGSMLIVIWSTSPHDPFRSRARTATS